MSTVSLFAKQTSKENRDDYPGHSCNPCSRCPAGEWHSGDYNCTSGVFNTHSCYEELCTRPQLSACPALGTALTSSSVNRRFRKLGKRSLTSASNVRFTNPGQCGAGDSSCSVTCDYPTSAFTALDTVSAYRNYNSGTTDINTDSQWTDRIMPTFCSQVQLDASRCPAGSTVTVEGKVVPGCSMINSLDSGGDYCRVWVKSVGAKADNTINTFVTKYHPNDDNGEAQCVNRSKNKVYQALGAGNFSNDSCWYLPCKGSDPTVLRTSDTLNPTCPTSVCSQLTQVVNSTATNISLSDIKSSINCNGQAPTKAVVTPPVVPTTTPSSSNSGSTSSGKKSSSLIPLIVIGVGVLLFLVILVLLVVFAVRSGRRR